MVGFEWLDSQRADVLGGQSRPFKTRAHSDQTSGASLTRKLHLSRMARKISAQTPECLYSALKLPNVCIPLENLGLTSDQGQQGLGLSPLGT